MINLYDNCLLMIEPSGLIETYVDDDLTNMAKKVFARVQKGTQWRGSHTCKCGARSGSCSLVIPPGIVTNSLMVHYIAEHRSEVPSLEITKLRSIYCDHSTEINPKHSDQRKCITANWPRCTCCKHNVVLDGDVCESCKRAVQNMANTLERIVLDKIWDALGVAVKFENHPDN